MLQSYYSVVHAAGSTTRSADAFCRDSLLETAPFRPPYFKRPSCRTLSAEHLQVLAIELCRAPPQALFHRSRGSGQGLH
jgi:hypothetical protein